MVRRGLSTSRSEAQQLIASGRVSVNGAIADKASRLVNPADALSTSGERSRYVSRGGLKLESALNQFTINPAGIRAIDVGASTGGFTDCLLQHQATNVVAIDVGRNQLHEQLKKDPRVISLEQTDVRNVQPQTIGGPAALVTVDLSFISLRLVASSLRALVTSELVALVKPQFEAGKAEVSRGRGIIRDPRIWQQVLLEVAYAFHNESLNTAAMSVSPLKGPAGNIEFFLYAQACSNNIDLDELRLESMVTSVVTQAMAMSKWL